MMFRSFATVIVGAAGVASSAFSQNAPSGAAPPGTMRIKSSHMVPFKDGALVAVRALLFRAVAPGMMRGHPRYVHALAVTNVPGVSCETPVLHGDLKKGVVLDLTPATDDGFLAVFHADFPDEPEYSYMGYDFFWRDSLGAFREGHSAVVRKGAPNEAEVTAFMRLKREEKFVVMREALPQMWPFRPRSATVITRTTVRGDKTGLGQILAVRAPNSVTLMARVDRLELEGEVFVTTCK